MIWWDNFVGTFLATPSPLPSFATGGACSSWRRSLARTTKPSTGRRQTGRRDDVLLILSPLILCEHIYTALASKKKTLRCIILGHRGIASGWVQVVAIQVHFYSFSLPTPLAWFMREKPQPICKCILAKNSEFMSGQGNDMTWHPLGRFFPLALFWPYLMKSPSLMD